MLTLRNIVSNKAKLNETTSTVVYTRVPEMTSQTLKTCKKLVNSKTNKRYVFAMVRVAFWAVLVILVALFLSYYLDIPVPEDVPEKFRVKVIDASMRTYKHLINGLVKLGITHRFSPLDRTLSDWFILTQTVGYPWGLSWNADKELRMNDTVIEGVRVKMYEPVSTIRHEERSALIFLHGGGWSTLSVDSYDPLIRKVARESRVVIISVNYRLSPEHPYPAPLEDCIRVVNHVTDNHFRYRLDPFRVAIGGDSAGGNLAASIALRLRYKLAIQFLIVPVLQMFDFRTSSFIENREYFHGSVNSPDSLIYVTNYFGVKPVHHLDLLQNNHTSLDFKRSEYAARVDQKTWMKTEYIRNPKLITDESNSETQLFNNELFTKLENKLIDPYVAPLIANDTMLRNLPEAYIITCGYDVIRDDGIMYAERLRNAGTVATLRHYPTGFHNSWLFPHGLLRLQVGADIVADLVKALKERL